MKSLKGKVLVSLASVAILGGVTLGSVGAFADRIDDLNQDTKVTARFSDENEPPILDDKLQLITSPMTADFGFDQNTPALRAGRPVSRVGHVRGSRVVVRDARPNADSGTVWKVTAKASALTTTNNDGSETSIEDASGNAANIKVTSSGVNAAKYWTPSPVTIVPGVPGADITQDFVKAEETVLPLGGAGVMFASATDTLGKGYTIPVDSMQLNIASTPESWAGKTFKGTILWTLDNTAS